MSLSIFIESKAAEYGLEVDAEDASKSIILVLQANLEFTLDFVKREAMSIDDEIMSEMIDDIVEFENELETIEDRGDQDTLIENEIVSSVDGLQASLKDIRWNLSLAADIFGAKEEAKKSLEINRLKEYQKIFQECESSLEEALELILI